MKSKNLKIFFFSFAMSLAQAEGYLPFADPLLPLQPLQSYKLNSNTDLYSNISQQSSEPKKFFVIAKNSRVIWNPATQKPNKIPDGYEAYLSPQQRIVIAPRGQRVCFSSRAEMRLDPGTLAYEDQAHVVKIINLAKLLEVKQMSGRVRFVLRVSENKSDNHEALYKNIRDFVSSDLAYLDPQLHPFQEEKNRSPDDQASVYAKSILVKNDPRLEDFLTDYAQARMVVKSIFEVKTLEKILGMELKKGESDPTYLNVMEGLTLGMLKDYTPEYWGQP